MYSKLRKPLSLILVIVMCFGIFGCSPKKNVQVTQTPSGIDEEVKNLVKTNNPNKLTLYLSEVIGADLNNNFFVDKRIPGISELLDTKVFTNAEDMETQLIPELIAGGGPDIFIFNSTMLPNFRHLLRQGLFANLDDLIEADTSEERLNLINYNTAAVEVGRWKDNHYIIPLGFMPDIFMTTQEMCEKYDITIPEDGVAYRELSDVFQNFINKEKDHYALLYPNFLLQDYAHQYIDMNTQTCTFNSEEFQKDLDIFNNINICSWTNMHQQGYHSDINAVSAGAMFCNYYMVSIGTRWDPSTIIADYKKLNPPQHPLLFGRKDDKGDGYVAHATLCFAINVNSTKKDLAYNFLKLLLSESVQSEELWFNRLIGIPVQNTIRKDYLSNMFHETLKGGIPSDEDGKYFIDKFIEICENITSCYMVDGKWSNEIFSPAMNNYTNGKITADQFAQTLQQKTNIFLKE